MTDRRISVHRTLLGMVAAFVLFAAACGGSADNTVESSAPAADPPAESSPADTAASDASSAEAALVASTVTGGQIDFGSLEGQDVVLWFWAPW